MTPPETPAKAAAEGATEPERLRLLPAERRAVLALGAIYSTRMLGLFGLLPVMALFAAGLPHATPLGIGIAAGAYAFTQALLQIPAGHLSDRIGRRPVITAGLLLFAAGSVLGALSSTFAYPLIAVIIARSLQGAGAISGPVTALLADLTRPQLRTRAMAFIGISIGACFVLSLVGSPVLAAYWGVEGLFWGMAAMAVAGIILLYTAVPKVPAREVVAAAATEGGEPLWPWYAGMFMLHGILTATFMGVPHILRDEFHIAQVDHWQFYLGVFVASLAGTAPMVLWAERSSFGDGVMRYGIAGLVFAMGILALGHSHLWAAAAGMTLFFAAFNFLEARLPARLTQAAGPARRGAALGIFATCQFLGTGFGYLCGGLLAGTSAGLGALFGALTLAAMVWLLGFRPVRPAAAAPVAA